MPIFIKPEIVIENPDHVRLIVFCGNDDLENRSIHEIFEFSMKEWKTVNNFLTYKFGVVSSLVILDEKYNVVPGLQKGNLINKMMKRAKIIFAKKVVENFEGYGYEKSASKWETYYTFNITKDFKLI